MIRYIFYFIFTLGLALNVAHCQQPAFFRTDSGGLKLAVNTLLGNANGFVVGELHDARITPEIKLALIKYLHENNSVNDVFMEVGHAAAYLYNSYLNTGDTAFITHPSLVYAGNDEGMRFWRRLYEYNKATGFTITVHGFDFERMEFVKVLRMLKPAWEYAPERLKAIVHYIDTIRIANVNGHNLVNSYARTKQQLQLYKGDFMHYYGDDFGIVQEVLTNENTYAAYDTRNKTMYAELNRQILQRKIEKFVLFAGVEHCNKMDKTSLAVRLSEGSGVVKNVLTMVMLCKNCDGIKLRDNAMPPIYAGLKAYCNDRTAMGALFGLLQVSNVSAAIVSGDSTQFQIKNSADLLIIAAE